MEETEQEKSKDETARKPKGRCVSPRCGSLDASGSKNASGLVGVEILTQLCHAVMYLSQNFSRPHICHLHLVEIIALSGVWNHVSHQVNASFPFPVNLKPILCSMQYLH